MKRKTIIFITVYPFGEDFALKYGFDILRRRGFNVAILNVMNFIFAEALVKKIPHYNILPPVGNVEQVCVRSGEELQLHLKRIEGWRIAVLVIFPYVRILRVLKRTGVRYIRTFTNLAPPPFSEPGSFVSRILNALSGLIKNPFKFFVSSVIHKLPPPLIGLQYPAYDILGSEEAHNQIHSSEIKCINAHSFDYDRYLRNREKVRPSYLPGGEFYVHIANHTWDVHDNVLLNIKPAIGKEEYARIINRFFDRIEENTGKSIIIAAYPKATDDENIYEGRPFLYDTEQLIKYSSGVFCHYSGAIKFAIIHKRPICFISIRQFQEYAYHRYAILQYINALNTEVHFIDREEGVQTLIEQGIFSYNRKVYEDYFNKYIATRCTNGRLLWDIVAEALDEEIAAYGK